MIKLYYIYNATGKTIITLMVQEQIIKFALYQLAFLTPKIASKG